MHLIQSEALNAGCKINRPKILSKYYPLTTERYICFQPYSKPSKNYSYWESVLQILRPILAEAKIDIVQIGGKDEKGFDGCIHTQGNTTFNQANYLIENSLLLFGTDSYSQHFGGAIYGKKMVTLFSNNYKNNVNSFFSLPGDQICIEPLRAEGEKPLFTIDDAERQIDRILPEDIAKAVCKQLNLPFHYPFQTVITGANFRNRIIEVVPNCVVNPNAVNVQSLVCRLDFEFNEQILQQQLSQCNCSIITSKPLNPGLINAFRQRISHIFYQVGKDYDKDFPKVLYKSGVPFTFYSFESEEFVTAAKLDFMEYGVLHRKIKPDIAQIKELQNRDLNNLYFKPAKITLSDGKIFPSNAHRLAGVSIDSLSPQIPLKVINSPEFWEELEYYSVLTRS